jgi:hypothetical protein
MGSQKAQIEKLSVGRRELSDELPFEQYVIKGDQLVATVRARSRDKFDEVVEKTDLTVVDETSYKSHRWYDEIKLEA